MSQLVPETGDYAERVTDSFRRQGLMQTLGAELAVVEAGFVEIHMPFSDAVTQQHGFFHAGGLAAIVDTAGGYAALSLFGADDGVLTVEFKVNLTAPAEGEKLVARGQVVKPGRTLTVCTGEVLALKDGNLKSCALMQQTMMRITGRDAVKG